MIEFDFEKDQPDWWRMIGVIISVFNLLNKNTCLFSSDEVNIMQWKGYYKATDFSLPYIISYVLWLLFLDFPNPFRFRESPRLMAEINRAEIAGRASFISKNSKEVVDWETNQQGFIMKVLILLAVIAGKSPFFSKH